MIAEMDFATFRFFETADHPQGRRLAAPARAEQCEKLALLDFEIDSVNRYESVESFIKILDA
jgi:hypothetical protein